MIVRGPNSLYVSFYYDAITVFLDIVCHSLHIFLYYHTIERVRICHESFHIDFELSHFCLL